MKFTSLFTQISYFEEFTDIIKSLNGLFSVIVKKDEQVFIAVDCIRMFPLFYCLNKNNIYISDSAEEISFMSGMKKLNETSINEFLLTGYVTGKDTILENIYQLQGGQCVLLNCNECCSTFYFNYTIKEVFRDNFNRLSERLNQVFYRAISRLVKSIGVKQAIVPLSGGFDSRFIATALKDFGLKNVVCFTYGRSKNNPEIKISERVAKRLGYRWYFIEYNKELINNFLIDPAFEKYWNFSSNFVSQFYMQEYFALKYLTEKQLIEKDAIFLPGHSGDFLGGSQLDKNGGLKQKASKNQILRSIITEKYVLNHKKLIDFSIIESKLKKQIESIYNDNLKAYSIFENWDMKEKLSKFNANSANVINYFGYEHRLLFWDMELVDFFKSVDFKFKIGKKLYDSVLSEFYFKKYNLIFKDELQPSRTLIKFQQKKELLKKYLPSKLKKRLFKNTDIFNYKYITHFMQKDLENNNRKVYLHNKYYNSVILQWILFKIDKKYNRN